MECPTALNTMLLHHSRYQALTILESIKLLATNFPMTENFAQTLSTTSDGVFGPNTPGDNTTRHWLTWSSLLLLGKSPTGLCTNCVLLEAPAEQPVFSDTKHYCSHWYLGSQLVMDSRHHAKCQDQHAVTPLTREWRTPVLDPVQYQPTIQWSVTASRCCPVHYLVFIVDLQHASGWAKIIDHFLSLFQQVISWYTTLYTSH